jgi:hypothetical protein
VAFNLSPTTCLVTLNLSPSHRLIPSPGQNYSESVHLQLESFHSNDNHFTQKMKKEFHWREGVILFSNVRRPEKSKGTKRGDLIFKSSVFLNLKGWLYVPKFDVLKNWKGRKGKFYFRKFNGHKIKKGKRGEPYFPKCGGLKFKRVISCFEVWQF